MKKIEASYILEGMIIENVNSINNHTWLEMEYTVLLATCVPRQIELLLSWDEIFINVLRM